ncbi:glutathione S-transferase family protein, partial [Mesorhizobium sp. M2E.F.Ca.ET.209.01.1.1]
ALKRLEGIISVSIVHHFLGANGWTFVAEDGATGDTLYSLDFLHQIYTRADSSYSGRVTVPVLWDKKEQTIVSNESSEII